MCIALVGLLIAALNKCHGLRMDDTYLSRDVRNINDVNKHTDKIFPQSGELISPPEPTIQRCLTDTWGMTGSHYSKPFLTKAMNHSCEFRHVEADRLNLMVLNYYPSMSAFEEFKGFDLIPSRHHEYLETGNLKFVNLTLWDPGKTEPMHLTQMAMLSSCEIAEQGGGTIHIQKLGPFCSTGNFDYWQLGWDDVWHMRKVLQTNLNGVKFDLSFAGPVDVKGKVLGHPPIHLHHFHILPSPGVRNKMNPDHFVPDVVAEQHGDYQCTEEDGGVQCLFERTPDGYEKVISTAVDVEGELNDVRAKNSKPMQWSFQLAIRWHRLTAGNTKPLSQLFISGPGTYFFNNQRTNVFPYRVNTSGPSLYWYAGRMRGDGMLIRSKIHIHGAVFDHALHFAAAPSDLGLDHSKFTLINSNTPIMLSDIGYITKEEVLSVLLNHLNAAQQTYGVACLELSECHARPALICEAWVHNDYLLERGASSSFATDRRSPTCCRPWKFQKGDVYTIVSFAKSPSTAPGVWDTQGHPESVLMHTQFFWTYEAPDQLSHYGFVMNGPDPDFSFLSSHAQYTESLSWAENCWRMLLLQSIQDENSAGVPVREITFRTQCFLILRLALAVVLHFNSLFMFAVLLLTLQIYYWTVIQKKK